MRRARRTARLLQSRFADKVEVLMAYAFMALLFLGILGGAGIALFIVTQRGPRYRKPSQTDLDLERAESEGMTTQPAKPSRPSMGAF